MSYTHWREDDEPNNVDGAEDCVQMTRKGEWIDGSCEEELAFAVCSQVNEGEMWCMCGLGGPAIRHSTPDRPLSEEHMK